MPFLACSARCERAIVYGMYLCTPMRFRRKKKDEWVWSGNTCKRRKSLFSSGFVFFFAFSDWIRGPRTVCVWSRGLYRRAEVV
ncbi:hypothetical protein HDV57DRAFT_481403 [Trichoderma longibrachiatum]|uniref:Uncharacterized protein n=1 Tax=Trichoderma longibrachiatum ATCC 18648 TaxID=983965 RepID=A0A2T4CHE9_TRILO|nr:hypothetical protein M440DRAFT_1396125 [Trichoderma longibrachiatum ATCC 18648]